MTRFLVLARERPGAFDGLSPEEAQSIVQRYVDWTLRLTRAGRNIASEKLRDGEGRILRGGADGTTVTDGPFGETKEVVGGFWILEAADYDEAVRLCSDSPHLEFGALEIRAVETL